MAAAQLDQSALKRRKPAIARIKVLIQLFQKLAGIQGTASLVDLRRGRNTQEVMKSSSFWYFFSSLKEKKYE